jgi:sugar lactone lactonase YvrE
MDMNTGLKRSKILIILFILLASCLNAALKNTSFNHQTNISNNNQRFEVHPTMSVQSGAAISKNRPMVERIMNWVAGEENVQLVRPMASLITTDGNLLIVDSGIPAVLQVRVEEGLFRSLPVATAQPWHTPVALTEGPNGRIYVCDPGNDRIYIRDADNGEFVPLDTPGLRRPTGIVYIATTNELWVLETSEHRIAVLDTAGNIKRYIGERGSGEGQFNFPTHIWYDGSGTVYVTDTMNFQIQKFSTEGVFKGCFGESGDATGYFARPKGIATDSYGHIYVVDALFHAVQIFSSDGKFLHFFGRQGRESGEFWIPTGIFIDASDNIYVADTYNARVQIFNLKEAK